MSSWAVIGKSRQDVHRKASQVLNSRYEFGLSIASLHPNQQASSEDPQAPGLAQRIYKYGSVVVEVGDTFRERQAEMGSTAGYEAGVTRGEGATLATDTLRKSTRKQQCSLFYAWRFARAQDPMFRMRISLQCTEYPPTQADEYNAALQAMHRSRQESLWAPNRLPCFYIIANAEHRNPFNTQLRARSSSLKRLEELSHV